VRRFRHRLIAALVMAAALGIAGEAPAEIYRWVDEEGNVHFGDRPHDAERAAGAPPVEVREAYRPPQRTSEEQAAYEREMRENFATTTRRLQQEKEVREEARAARRQRQAELCIGYREHLGRLTRIQVDDSGRPVRHYLSENGRSLTVSEQEDYLNELRAKMVEAGCE